MKKVVAVLVSIAILVTLAACGGSGGSSSGGQGSSVSENDAIAAFVVVQTVVFTSSMMIAFGQQIDGVSVGDDGTVTYDNVSVVSVMEAMGGTAEDNLPDVAYTTMSGTMSESDGGALVDVTLAGGPVSSMKFTLTEEMFASGEEDQSTNVSVEVNGRQMELEITPEKLQAIM